MRMQRFILALCVAAAPVVVLAQVDDTDTPGVVPEPATLALLAAGAAAWLVTRNKRK